MRKSLDTLVEDIYGIFVQGAKPDPEVVREFGQQLSQVVADRLQPRDNSAGFTLRMSNLGRPDRQLWYQKHLPASDQEVLQPHTLLKFLIGDVWEHVMLFLAKAAGHEVSHEQEEVRLDGIVGHIDALIDGTVVDVKSASTHAFKKFRDGTLAEDDPFGYVEQISGYATAFDTDGAFLAGDKQNGHIALHKVSKDDIEAIDIKARIEHCKRILDEELPPPRCYKPVPEGESGNLRLDTGCSYCPFKHHCWADVNNGVGLRTFLYARGPVHFVEVVKEPKVPEITF